MAEFNAKLGQLELSLEWRLTLLVVIMLPILVILGFWQLERAEEKRAISLQYALRSALPAMGIDELSQKMDGESLASLDDRRLDFSGVVTKGNYLLLDNRTRDGRFGYEVIAIVTAGTYRVPLNLGWIPGDPTRRSLPQPALSTTEQDYSGRVYLGAGQGFMLGEQLLPESLPAVIQSYEAERFAQQLPLASGAVLLPVMVRIDENHPMAKRADWPVVNQSPEKHTGYAVQWFTMAAVLLIAFVLRSSNVLALVRRQPPAKTPERN